VLSLDNLEKNNTMPNRVRTRIVITGPADQRASIKELLYSPENQSVAMYFDLNKVIPMPPSLDVTSGSTSDDAMALASYVDKLQPWRREFNLGTVSLYEQFKLPHNQKEFKSVDAMAHHLMTNEPGLLTLGRKLMDNIAQHGAPTWYEWRNMNWGTKWNAYDQSFEETSRALKYTFHTAWDTPRKVLVKLKDTFHRLKFDIHVDGEVDEKEHVIL